MLDCVRSKTKMNKTEDTLVQADKTTKYCQGSCLNKKLWNSQTLKFGSKFENNMHAGKPTAKKLYQMST